MKKHLYEFFANNGDWEGNSSWYFIADSIEEAKQKSTHYQDFVEANKAIEAYNKTNRPSRPLYDIIVSEVSFNDLVINIALDIENYDTSGVKLEVVAKEKK
jgi:hypothetical protein